MCYAYVRILIKTNVEADWRKVKEGFSESLFLKLNPPFPKVQLKQFDGCLKGDVVEMELNFLLWKDTWRSDITADNTTESSFEFVDEGTKLPFPFKKWTHKHGIVSKKGQTTIIDDITYEASYAILTPLLYPLLYLQFIYRKPIYKKTFS